MVLPSAGSTPTKTPIPLERRMVLRTLRKSSRDGRRSADMAATTLSRPNWRDWLSSSVTANSPISTGMNCTPSRSCGTPKVNRSTPVVRSMPTVAMSSPRHPPMRFFTGDSAPMDASIDRANTPSAKYSGGPKL